MFKVVRIEGKNIPMKSNGSTAVLYSRFFNRNMLGDFFNLAKMIEDGREMESNVIEQIAWTLAKTANDSIPDYMDWLSQFESPMSIYESAKDIFSLVTSDIKSTQKYKKKQPQKQMKK